MFDNLREQANASPFYEDEAKFQQGTGIGVQPPSVPSNRPFMGMTAPQRFIVAVMLMMVVCVLGAMLLLVSGRIAFM